MTKKTVRAFVVALLAVFTLAGACSPKEVAKEDSESHFLSLCVDHCSSGLTCLCGVCTAPCAAAAECAALSAHAECLACGAPAASTQATCDVSCTQDADCKTLGTNHRCVGQRCRGQLDIPSDTGFPLDAAITNPPAEPSKVVVIWQVSSGTPDYSYKFGEAPLVDGKVSLRLPSPPDEALNGGTLGVGLLLVVPLSTTLPDGRLASTSPDAGSPDAGSPATIVFPQQLIYRKTLAQQTGVGWELNFAGLGYACATCQNNPVGFASFIQVECPAQTTLVTPAQYNSCNWT